jgi:4'-phosphopantetheinyl transferase EntD
MMADLVPPTVRVHESADPSLWQESPVAAERAAVCRAVTKRRVEYGAVRELGRQALADLGVPPRPILSGPHREPLWPAGVVGSITHCAGYCAAAVAARRDVLTIGIDAEPATPLADHLAEMICRPEELLRFRILAEADPEKPWTKLAFSIKEAIYKAWWPVTQQWLGFTDVDLDCDPTGRFRATLLVPAPPSLSSITGRFSVQDGLVGSVAVVEAPGRRDPRLPADQPGTRRSRRSET